MQAQSVAPLYRGEALPDVVGQSLSGTPAHLSTVVAGKVAVVVFSFSKAGGKDTQLWTRNLVRDFGSDRSVALSTVIMLEAAPRLLRGIIVSRLKNDMPPSLRGSTIVSYENEKVWKQRLRTADDSHAYVVLLGPDGRIRWMNSGALSDTEYTELKAKIQEQIPGNAGPARFSADDGQLRSFFAKAFMSGLGVQLNHPGHALITSNSVNGAKGHHAAVRALAFKWIRIAFRCWKNCVA